MQRLLSALILLALLILPAAGRADSTPAPPDASLYIGWPNDGEVVKRTGDFPDAFRRAQAAGTLALIELHIDPEALTPKYSLTQIREGALSGGR